MNQLSGTSAQPSVLHGAPTQKFTHADGLAEVRKFQRRGYARIVFTGAYDAPNKPYETAKIHERYLSRNPAAEYDPEKNNLRTFLRIRALNQVVDAKGINPSDTAAVMAELKIICASII